MAAPDPWRVLIVDEDVAAAAVHRRMVSAQPGFSVRAMAVSGEDAIAILGRGVRIDLVLLDVELPGAGGVEVLREIRARGGPEAIATTAARESQALSRLVHLGIVDCLVKPFVIERLQLALLRFRNRMRALGAPGALEQRRIDLLFASPRRHLVPKGLHTDTLDAVRSVLRLAGEDFSSAETVARQAAVARVTARRYLEYLVSSQQAEMDTHCEGAGRPRKLYRLSSPAS